MRCFGMNVELGENIPGTDLTQILVSAAREIGWRARLKVKYNYCCLTQGGQYSEELYINVLLRGMVFPKLNVAFCEGGENGENYGVVICLVASAGRKEVERYLSALSRRVGEYQAAHQ